MLSSNTNMEKKLSTLCSHGIHLKTCVRFPVASGVTGGENYFLPKQMKTRGGVTFRNPFSSERGKKTESDFHNECGSITL